MFNSNAESNEDSKNNDSLVQEYIVSDFIIYKPKKLNKAYMSEFIELLYPLWAFDRFNYYVKQKIIQKDGRILNFQSPILKTDFNLSFDNSVTFLNIDDFFGLSTKTWQATSLYDYLIRHSLLDKNGNIIGLTKAETDRGIDNTKLKESIKHLNFDIKNPKLAQDIQDALSSFLENSQFIRETNIQKEISLFIFNFDLANTIRRYRIPWSHNLDYSEYIPKLFLSHYPYDNRSDGILDFSGNKSKFYVNTYTSFKKSISHNVFQAGYYYLFKIKDTIQKTHNDSFSYNRYPLPLTLSAIGFQANYQHYKDNQDTLSISSILFSLGMVYYQAEHSFLIGLGVLDSAPNNQTGISIGWGLTLYPHKPISISSSFRLSGNNFWRISSADIRSSYHYKQFQIFSGAKSQSSHLLFFKNPFFTEFYIGTGFHF